MRHIVLGLLSALASVLMAAHGVAQNAQHVRGQILAEKLCASCHSVGRNGVSPHAKAPPFHTLGKRYPVEHLAEALAEGIRTGHPDMPEFKFSPLEVGALITYLKEISAGAK